MRRIPSNSRVHDLARIAGQFWDNSAVLQESPSLQKRQFVRLALVILAQEKRK